MSTFELKKGSTRLSIADPTAPEPYYRGTRFDRSGVILSLESSGHSFVGQWFLKYDPYMHDAVSGPSEEFTQIGYEDAKTGDTFLKIGVGVLRRDDAAYDRFHLYEIADAGEMTVEHDESSATFRHLLKGIYDYSKKVEIPADGRLRITHGLQNLTDRDLECYVYCHNFFVLDGAFTGVGTRLEFPFRPAGDWRAEYDCVGLAGKGIAFSRNLREGESVFMGNLHPETNEFDKGMAFSLSNTEKCLKVIGTCDRAADYSVFWANHEVACIEPYIPLRIPAGSIARWTLEYDFLISF